MTEWTEVGWIEVDTATVGFGDGACRSMLGRPLLDLHLDRRDPAARVVDFTHYGVPLIVFLTMEDRDYPVELARDRAGRLLGARICLTSDVDELEDELAGSWQPVGAVPITSATCLAADPFIDRELYQRSFECPNGLFPVEVFEWPDPEDDGDVDRLGIRIRFGDRSALEHPDWSTLRGAEREHAGADSPWRARDRWQLPGSRSGSVPDHARHRSAALGEATHRILAEADACSTPVTCGATDASTTSSPSCCEGLRGMWTCCCWTEAQVEQACVRTFKATEGMVLALSSAQNIDRLVTLYRAALQSGRDLVMDLYAASIATATGNQHIPRPGADWPRVRVYVPPSQRRKVKATGAFWRVEQVRPFRIFGPAAWTEHRPSGRCGRATSRRHQGCAWRHC